MELSSKYKSKALEKCKKLLTTLFSRKLSLLKSDTNLHDIFDFTSEDNAYVFSTKNDSNQKFVLPCKLEKETDSEVILEIEEHYNYSDDKLIYYRYGIAWHYECELKNRKSDYLEDAIIDLKRSIRFEHNIFQIDKKHPKYHWHPNGCPDLRLPTVQMNPYLTAIFAIRAFDVQYFEENRSSIGTSDAEIIENAFFKL